MAWQDQLRGDSVSWLLEHPDPGVRYLALRDLADRPAGDGELAAARREAHERGPIATVLDNMAPEGYWEREGPGYGPKYRSTVWAMILLAQLGATIGEDERLVRACDYVLDHALMPHGQFSYSRTSSSTIPCLHGNLCASLLALGNDDPRLVAAVDWMARSITGEGIAPAGDRSTPRRWYAYHCGPLFACGPNNKLPCAWGAAKVMWAFALWPAERRTPEVQRGIDAGVEFLLGTDPATALYPSGWNDKPSGNWWKFGFPVFYVTDILQVVDALVGLGYGRDPRLANALALIRDKQDEQGCWPLEYHYNSKTWINSGRKNAPNPWVTLRALRVLKAVG